MLLLCAWLLCFSSSCGLCLLMVLSTFSLPIGKSLKYVIIISFVTRTGPKTETKIHRKNTDFDVRFLGQACGVVHMWCCLPKSWADRPGFGVNQPRRHHRLKSPREITYSSECLEHIRPGVCSPFEMKYGNRRVRKSNKISIRIKLVCGKNESVFSAEHMTRAKVNQ